MNPHRRHIVPFHRTGFRDPAPADFPQSSDRNSSEKGGDDVVERWKLSESLVMAAAALRVVGPYVLLILVTVLAAWGLWALMF